MTDELELGLGGHLHHLDELPSRDRAAWTSPRTWTVGETVTAAMMNTHVRDNLNAIGAQAARSGYNLGSAAAFGNGAEQMAGYGATAAFTPATTGWFAFSFVFNFANAGGAGASTSWKVRYGTGAAPANAAAATGTVIGQNPVSAGASGLVALIGAVGGLSIGTAYWVDVSGSGGANVTLSQGYGTALEIGQR